MISFMIIVTFQTLEAKAAWGDFDTSFGLQGATVDPITGYYPRSVVIQPDGKILVTGYRVTTLGGKGFFLRRYLSNGQLDTAFGNNGAATVPEPTFINADYRGERIVVQSNGKIAVAGWANGDYAVWQFTSSGRGDPAFGQNGLQVLTRYPLIGSEKPEINIQNGKILLSLPKELENNSRLALIRLTSNGTIDNAFGNFGESLTNLFGTGFGTIVETNGAITVSGNKFDGSYTKGLERKLANGQTDLSFFPTPSSWNGTLRQGLVKSANGKYVLAILNLAGNGSVTLFLDKFSSSGVFESSLAPYNGFQISGCPDVFTYQNDGKLLVQSAGKIFRLNAELNGGTMETNSCSNLNGISNFARAAVQTDDKMVVTGVANNYLILARLLPN